MWARPCRDSKDVSARSIGAIGWYVEVKHWHLLQMLARARRRRKKERDLRTAGWQEFPIEAMRGFLHRLRDDPQPDIYRTQDSFRSRAGSAEVRPPPSLRQIQPTNQLQKRSAMQTPCSYIPVSSRPERFLHVRPDRAGARERWVLPFVSRFEEYRYIQPSRGGRLLTGWHLTARLGGAGLVWLYRIRWGPTGRRRPFSRSDLSLNERAADGAR
jgi:hypothetical protein